MHHKVVVLFKELPEHARPESDDSVVGAEEKYVGN
jgi:hypothetical protein